MTPTIFDWTRYRSAAYLVGKGIHFGIGFEPILPRAAKTFDCYCVGVNPAKQAHADVCTDNLNIFADRSVDWVFVGRAIEALEDSKGLIQQAFEKLKMGGHLILMVPLNVEPAPHVIHSFTHEGLLSMVCAAGAWKRKHEEIKEGHLFGIYKKIGPRKGDLQTYVRPSGPMACVVRYGAFGDMIMITPLLRKLKEDGYHVTVNCTTYSQSMLENNPFVDNVVVQERECIPNPQLGPYWEEWKSHYDRYINLSESIEGKLLAVEGRSEFYSPKAFRQWRSNRNYYDFTLELGGYGGQVTHPRGELFFSPKELQWAKDIRRQYTGKFLLICALSGSSFHKIYGLFEPVLKDWLDRHPLARAVTVGDQLSRLLEIDHPQAHKAAGLWPIRNVMCLTQLVDCVLGPETGVLNAAGCFATPKITMLSHSTHENLCSHWEGDFCLAPDQKIAPCYPCHQLPYTRTACPQSCITDELGGVLADGPVCAMGAIQGERLAARLDEVYRGWEAKSVHT